MCVLLCLVLIYNKQELSQENSKRGRVYVLIVGILVVNVTWRGKTFVGTLMDSTRLQWASPR